MTAAAKIAQLEGLTRRFADLAATLSYDALPEPVVDKAKLILRDSIGIQIAASAASESARKSVDLIRRWGGSEEATVIGYGFKAPAPHAAQCNAMMAHGLQLDDTHSAGLLKAGSVLVPSVFAAAQLTGANGKAVITALVIGYEMAVRIARAINPSHRQRGFHTSGTVAGFGAAAMTGRLLGMDAEAIASSLGLAGSQAGGLVAFLDDPCLSKPLLTGKAAFNGVLSGLLAKEGLSGPRTVLESKEGFLNAFTDDVDLDGLLDGLGSAFVIEEVGLKPHAACRYSHAPIDLAQRMFHEDGIRLSDVQDGTVWMSEIAARQTSIPVSETLAHSMGSTEFSVALALEMGANGLPECWAGFDNRHVHAGAKRFAMEVEPSFPAASRETILEVRTRDGRTIRYQQALPKGEPSNPMTVAELERKFFSLATMVIDPDQARRLGARLMTIDEEPVAGDILADTAASHGIPRLRDVADRRSA